MKKKTFVQERNGDLLPDEGLLIYYFSRNLPCIRREAPGEVPVGVRVLNSYGYFRKVKTAGDGARIRATAVNGE